MSKNGNTHRYFIKLLVRGFEPPFFYEVGTEEFDRLRSVLAGLPQQREEKKTPNLFMFHTVNQLVVGVSTTAIQLAHFLVEKSTARDPDEDNGEVDPDRSQIHLYFRGRSAPYKISAAESGDDTAAIYFQLETGTFETHEFYFFLDSDGEEAAFRLQDVLVAEFERDVLDESRGDADVDMGALEDF